MRLLVLSLCTVLAAPVMAEQSAPLILRGDPVPRAPAPQPADRGQDSVTVQAGRVLWMVDPERDRVVACRLSSTTQVGVEVVRCREGRID